MTRTYKLLGAAAAVLMMVATSTAPAKAQFAGGGEDMMTQMAPMLNMMKAKMGKKRFGMLMQTMGPMMSKMMDGSGGGFGGMNFGGLGGGNFGSLSSGNSAPYAGTPSIGGDSGTTYAGGGLPFIGGGDGFNAGDMMGMIPQLMSLANMGGSSHHRRHAHHKS